MSRLFKLLTLLALIATHPSPMIQASPIDPYNQPSPALAPENMINNNDPYSPSPNSYEEDLSPEPQYPNDEEEEEEEDMSPEYQYPAPSPLAYAPDIEEDYPYAENPSLSPSHAEDVDDDDLYYSPYGAPSPTPIESMYSGVSNATSHDVMAPQVDATPPVLPFNYSAEDDSGELSSEDYDEEEYPELKKKNRAVIGFVLGAICLVGLGGLVYKKGKNQKHDYPIYKELSKKADV